MAKDAEAPACPMCGGAWIREVDDFPEPDGIAEKRDYEAREMAKDLRLGKFERMERGE